MAANRNQVIGECIDRVGWRRGARLAEFIFEWEVCVRAHKRDVTSEEFAAWWKDSRATTYRRLADFREAFPQVGPHGTPSVLMWPLLQSLEGRAASAKHLDSLPLDLRLAGVT